MALTKGTIGPIVPYAVGDTASSVFNIPMCLANSEVIQVGDIIVQATTVGSSDSNTDPTVKTVIGVAMESLTAVASATPNDAVVVALAIPGRPFIANLCGATGTDLAAYVVGTHNSTGYGFAEADYGGYTIIDVSESSTKHALVLGLAAEQLKGQAKALAIINPRVYFTFMNPIFVAAYAAT